MTITIHIHELNLLEDTLQNQYDSNFESDHEMLRDEINKSDCDLSTLENSAKLHKIMLKSFRNLLKENYNREVIDCPIT